MRSLLLLGICSVAWSVWLIAVLLDKRARGDAGGISLFPAIPLFPAAACLSGLGLDHVIPGAGFYMLDGLHIFLAVLFLASSVISYIRIKKGKIPSDE